MGDYQSERVVDKIIVFIAKIDFQWGRLWMSDVRTYYTGFVDVPHSRFIDIHRIPLKVLSLIPDCYVEGGEDYKDKDSIALTHEHHGWRDILTSCPLL